MKKRTLKWTDRILDWFRRRAAKHEVIMWIADNMISTGVPQLPKLEGCFRVFGESGDEYIYVSKGAMAGTMIRLWPRSSWVSVRTVPPEEKKLFDDQLESMTGKKPDTTSLYPAEQEMKEGPVSQPR